MSEEFWADDAAAIRQAEEQRAIEARTGLRMPPASGKTPQPKPSTFRPAAQKPVPVATPESKSAAKAIFALAVVFVAFLIIAKANSGKVKTTPQPEQGVSGSMLNEQERELRRVVGELIDSRVLLKVVTTGQTPEMYVLPAFHLLDVDRKTQIVTAVYHVAHRLAMDGKEFSGRLWVYDGLTGEHLRTFDKSFYGLQW